MNFDNDLMLFFRTIYEDSADMDECSAKVKSAVAAVADKLDIVRAELAVKMPATKLCEDGADMLMVLYDGEKDVENEPFEASFPLFEGGFYDGSEAWKNRGRQRINGGKICLRAWL